MRQPFSWKKVTNHLVLNLFKKKFVTDLHHPGLPKIGHALLYHKTESLTPGYRHTYIHTNHWEITCLVKILNGLGFWVDVIDRSINESFLPPDKYNIFIGIGVDESGRHYAKYARHLTKAHRILYATNANPELGNKNILARQKYFQQRHNTTLPTSRLTPSINMAEVMTVTDAIISVGNKYANESFSDYHKPLYKINVSTAPNLKFSINTVLSKQKNNWLFFAGNGNFKKGLDLVIDAFLGLPYLQLHLCTELEPEFQKFYAPRCEKATNIHFHSPVLIGHRQFNALTDLCGFAIQPSATEGTPTALASCLRRGLIPVVTYETGLNIENFGHLLQSTQIKNLQQSITHLAAMPDHEFQHRVLYSHAASWQYTQSSYHTSLTTALVNILTKEQKLP